MVTLAGDPQARGAGKVCPACHTPLPAEAAFCLTCGRPVGATPPGGAPADPFIGQTFKQMYFVEARIGGGGMGDVYRARHVGLDIPLALKILKKALHADASVVQRFQREARAASHLRHPGIVHVTDFGQTDDGTLYMVMEYVAGRSLARAIAEEFPFSEARVVHVGEQILAALAEAHAAKLLHRDLKPENVMLEARRDDPDAVKVLDFGIAKVLSPDSNTTLTQAGLICGTPGYMSPEQWSGEPLDLRSDLYAVGVLLYQMLTARLPFEARTPAELMRKSLTDEIPPPSSVRRPGRISPDLEAVVMRALSRDRERRHASADEMRAALRACAVAPTVDALRGGGTEILPTPGDFPTPGRTPSRLAARREGSRAPTPAAPSTPARVSPPERLTPSAEQARLARGAGEPAWGPRPTPRGRPSPTAAEATGAPVAVASHSLGASFPGLMYSHLREHVQLGQSIRECAVAMRDDPEFLRSRLLRLLNSDPKPIALIGICIRPDGETLADFRAAGVPVVLIDEAAEGASTVASDSRAAGRIAAEHLLDTGRRSIAVVAGKLDVNGGYNAVQRVKGVTEALAQRGLSLPPENVVQVVDYSRKDGEAALATLLRSGRGVDAVFCAAGDICATGLLACARERRLPVPDQLALLGFDDLPLASLSHPPLSTVRQPLEEISRRAWELATERTAEILDRPQQVLLAPELVRRSTT